MEFLTIFCNVFIGMLEIFFIIICGILFFRFKLIDRQALSGLSRLTINLFLPCLIFVHLIKNFNFDHPANWWLYPILGIAVSLVGFLIASIVALLSREKSARKEMKLLIAFQNCGYLPLLLVSSVFPPAVSNEFFTLIFLFIQGFNVVFWGFGIGFLQEKDDNKFDFKKIFNAPFIALILSFVFVAARLRSFMPPSVMRVAELLGNCTLPVALLILGGVLAGVFESKRLVGNLFFVKIIAGKLILMPTIMLLVIWAFKLPEIVALVLLIEAAMPSAVNLGVVAYYNKAEYETIGRAVLFTHLAGIITIPLFVSLFFLIMKG